jgi:hypothetical protein
MLFQRALNPLPLIAAAMAMLASGGVVAADLWKTTQTPQDSDVFLLMGDSYARGVNRGKPGAARMRADLYERAINVEPQRRAGYVRLVDALLLLEQPLEEDLRFLRNGLKLFPGEDWLQVGAASVEYRLGRKEAARAGLEHTLRAGSTLDPLQHDQAQDMLRTWLVEAMNSELEVATSQTDPDVVLVVVRKYRDQLADVELVTSFLDHMEARMNAIKAKAAAAGSRPDPGA